MRSNARWSTLALLVGIAAAALSPVALAAQDTTAPAAPTTPATVSVQISRGQGVPYLDGRDDEPFWQQVPVRGGFREARPTEDADPKQNTTFRIAYDETYLYVFVRAYDTSPDSIIKLLSRRDDQTSSDQIGVMLDSYHDKRTGYEFIVNPLGVKADYAISNDGNEDEAWNAIWDVVTLIDSLGWAAEYRIPFSQLRFELAEEMTFGFMIWRDLARHTAAISYPLYRQSRPGFPSQFGELTGLSGVARPDRLELIPYVLTQNAPDLASSTGEREQSFHAGADLKYAVAPNITLNATINPDFGQVEADPSAFNLSAFEIFFDERRPFFVEGANIFSFPINCFAVVDCSTGEGLFYSRRIGKEPTLLGVYGDQGSPNVTRILGAAKLSGRGGGGVSVGFLDAVTERVHNSADVTLEPFTNYATLRLNKDSDGGNTSLGLMLTGVNRANEDSSSKFLHDAAYSGGFDARRRLGFYEISGSLMGSYVMGSEEAIARTQQRPAHYYQRPDDDIEFDPTLTSLSGHAVEARFGKVGGEHTRFETGYGRRSAGFETNDIGFLNRADQQTWTNWFAYRWNRPAAFYQRINWNLNWWQYWSLEGLPTERAFNTNVHMQLNSRWWVHAGSTIGAGQVYCDRNCTRGGPALKVEPSLSPWMGIEGDNRKPVVPFLWFNANVGDGGRSHYYSIEPQVNIRVASRFSTSISVDLSKNDDDSQWYGNFVDTLPNPDVTHYTFADLQQKTVAITWRLNYTFTPEMTFQLYASPFITKGTYTRVRELADPRADEYEDRFQAYGDTAVANNPGGFNLQEFRSNAVFRWEYRPGSTLFLVWSQGRGQINPVEGDENFGGDFQNLFDLPAEDRFLIKVSYWFSK
jgi:hypothetical protein